MIQASSSATTTQTSHSNYKESLHPPPPHRKPSPKGQKKHIVLRITLISVKLQIIFNTQNNTVDHLAAHGHALSHQEVVSSSLSLPVRWETAARCKQQQQQVKLPPLSSLPITVPVYTVLRDKRTIYYALVYMYVLTKK